MPVAPQCNQNASALIYALTMYFSHALIGLDEVVLKIAGVKHWLWRAVDQTGIVLDVLVRTLTIF